MNGGPGASSLNGLFAENGPLLLNSSGKLTPNPFAWNRHANLLFVEFGPGVGFSYCANSTTAGPQSPCPQARSDCSPCFTSDDRVAEQNVRFLETLLTDRSLFPALAGRPLYIAGESYAGVYGPTLALGLLKSASSAINLRGLWVTDPCTDNSAQYGWLDLGVSFAWQKGLIDRPTFTALTGAACTSRRTRVGDRVRDVSTDACKHAWRLYDLATAGIGDAVHPEGVPSLPLYIDPLSALGPSGGPNLEAYLGSATVRAALHTAASPNRVYHAELSNNGYPQYELQYAACNDGAAASAPSMLSVYREIIGVAARNTRPTLRQLIISSGDIDPVVDMHGTESAVLALGLNVTEGGSRRPWFFNATGTALSALASTPTAWGASLHAHGAGPQVGGFVTSFETGVRGLELQFVAIRNSGHMVPAYAPQRAAHVLHRALFGGVPLAPPLPAGWDAVPDEQFYAREGGGAPGLFAS